MKSCLVLGNNPAFGHDLTEEIMRCNDRVLINVAQDDESIGEVPGKIHCMPLSRVSPVGIRSFLFKAQNLFDGIIDEAILVYTPPAYGKVFHDTSTADLERMVDEEIKSCLFFLREILSLFHRSGRGSLSLVLYDQGSEILPPVDAVSAGAFEALTNSLFTYYQNEPIMIRGFRSSVVQGKEFARFIIGTLGERPEKTNGKWHRYPQKSGLFALKK